ncbi:MAG: sigma-70 family RNA polymerase sigma factor [bacterium]
MNRLSPGRSLPRPADSESEWERRSARLFEQLRGPATGMVRRAFGRTFDQHAIEDIYASAWLGTLRALARRHAALSDEEVRRYVFTAVARQASKELRRRRRRPISPLEKADTIRDAGSLPDERADQREQSQITRDLLVSLPRRRRAVLMLRYGWGLEPRQVCELIDGLSPRAYRKEITRGLDQLADRIRALEKGEWCADREPILKAFAAGIADVEERRQAEHHIAHCRQCARFVSRLSGHLHDAGGAVAVSGSLELVTGGGTSLWDRLVALAGTARDSLPAFFGPAGGSAPELATAAVAALCIATGVLGPAQPGHAAERAPDSTRAARPQAQRVVAVPPPTQAHGRGAARSTAPDGRPAAAESIGDRGKRGDSRLTGGRSAPPGQPILSATHTRNSYSSYWSGGSVAESTAGSASAGRTWAALSPAAEDPASPAQESASPVAGEVSTGAVD